MLSTRSDSIARPLGIVIVLMGLIGSSVGASTISWHDYRMTMGVVCMLAGAAMLASGISGIRGSLVATSLSVGATTGLVVSYLVVMHTTLHGLDPFTTLMACVSVVICLLELAVVRVDEDKA